MCFCESQKTRLYFVCVFASCFWFLFDLIWSGFYLIWLVFIWLVSTYFAWFLLDLTGFYLIWVGSTWFDWFLLGLTGFYLVWLVSTWSDWILLILTNLYLFGPNDLIWQASTYSDLMTWSSWYLLILDRHNRFLHCTATTCAPAVSGRFLLDMPDHDWFRLIPTDSNCSRPTQTNSCWFTQSPPPPQKKCNLPHSRDRTPSRNPEKRPHTLQQSRKTTAHSPHNPKKCNLPHKSARTPSRNPKKCNLNHSRDRTLPFNPPKKTLP